MSTAAQHRLRRNTAHGQLPLELELDGTDTALLESGTAFDTLAARLRPQFTDQNDPWAASPYRWIKDLAPARRGKAGAALTQTWLRAAGLDPLPAVAERYDLAVDSTSIDVKTSTLWTSGAFTFQGVAGSTADVLALLAIAPDRIRLWLVPAADAHANLDGGQSGWITLDADNPAPWISTHAATPERARALFVTTH